MSGGSDIQGIGKQFVEYYYKKFDTDRTKLADLFRDDSCMTFESKSSQGRDAIMTHICREVKFKKIQHRPRTLDVQPTGGGLLVMVTGELKVDSEENPLLFTEVFNLRPTKKDMRSFWVKNVVFRLNYASG